MKKIKILFFAILLIITLLWLTADTFLSQDFLFFAVRSSLISYTGLIGIGVMSIAMILALRPVFMEPVTGGLDKTYRLHKWLGITGLVISIMHWLLVKAPKWMIGWGMLERPARGPRPEQTNSIFIFFQEQRGLAESIGEWAFYAVVILLSLALIKKFPYKHFFKTHRLLPIVYLFLVFHSVVLTPFYYWNQAIAPVMAILMLGGTVAAIISLSRKVGYHRKAIGEITQLEYFTDNRVLSIDIKLLSHWRGHQTGQFAFVTFDKDEGAHPFTISSSWNNDGHINFMVKGLGDYTNAMPRTLKKGDLASIEGPYGRFMFNGDKPRQIWIGGGIGITPFIARLQKLSTEKHNQIIHLFYSTSAPQEDFIERLRKLAEKAKVTLHVIVSGKDPRLNADRICNIVPDWQTADIWFCGPAGFGKSLKKDMIQKGLSEDYFHQELFNMR
ncbi:ferric reductase-like transmembrane domain-containing protein [Advenella sp. RU8]|uniref:ferredoxin reductase family protein n=1 Tax=Advenella sp. RU8 TaxID=3399575 RepID=UPI003AAC6CAA